ncbi:MAG: hypothetical protein PHF32_08715 [Candidatus Cloacimonetes bacterium]|nr:hypothetical protein [Candidatus Cloacimonadota bacterium]MDD4560796.1 hypothetical protein [Candidatus Cloacimonadota bacterium]
MGTQQILLIVLSVIIVGAAIAVGIQMFNAQAYSANKSAIAADAQSFASQVVQYYKTPESQGGAGGNVANMTVAKIGGYIGWGGHSTNNDSGEYIITAETTTVTIYGLGKEVKGGKRPAVRTRVTLADGTINARAIDTEKTDIADVPSAAFGS